MSTVEPTGRRPLKSRQSKFFQAVATWLARTGVRPNAISFMSMIFACGAGAVLAATSHLAGWAQRGCWLLAALLIQMRLIANLLDGMVAVEGRRGGPTGDLWNEAPDRLSDAAIFVGTGYAAGGSLLLGFGAALMAVFVAYVRALGASVGAGQVFTGPMAKPQRMFLITVLGVVGAMFPFVAEGRVGGAISRSALEFTLHDTYYICRSASAVPFSGTSFVLLAIIAGCGITAIRRLLKIAQYLRSETRP